MSFEDQKRVPKYLTRPLEVFLSRSFSMTNSLMSFDSSYPSLFFFTSEMAFGIDLVLTLILGGLEVALTVFVGIFFEIPQFRLPRNFFVLIFGERDCEVPQCRSIDPLFRFSSKGCSSRVKATVREDILGVTDS